MYRPTYRKYYKVNKLWLSKYKRIIIYCKARIHVQLFLSLHFTWIIMRGFHEQIADLRLFSLLLRTSTHITAADIRNYSLWFTQTPNKFPPSKVFWSLWKNQASTLEEQQLLLIISWLLPNPLCHPCARWRNLYKIPIQQYFFYFYIRKMRKLFT